MNLEKQKEDSKKLAAKTLNKDRNNTDSDDGEYGDDEYDDAETESETESHQIGYNRSQPTFETNKKKRGQMDMDFNGDEQPPNKRRKVDNRVIHIYDSIIFEFDENDEKMNLFLNHVKIKQLFQDNDAEKYYQKWENNKFDDIIDLQILDGVLWKELIEPIGPRRRMQRLIDNEIKNVFSKRFEKYRERLKPEYIDYNNPYKNDNKQILKSDKYENIDQLLDSIGLDEYTSIFRKNEIKISDLPLLQRIDFENLFTNKHHRNVLQRKIENMTISV